MPASQVQTGSVTQYDHSGCCDFFHAADPDAVASGTWRQCGGPRDVQAQPVASRKANAIDLVTAVAEAETAIDALAAVRDNVIQSYQEIMRMTI
jgi:flagellar hook-basal body complex protein FliE